MPRLTVEFELSDDELAFLCREAAGKGKTPEAYLADHGLEDLRWLMMDPDERPQVGGPTIVHETGDTVPVFRFTPAEGRSGRQ